jgi:EmrB/QacA subfamily drug resistance transporter
VGLASMKTKENMSTDIVQAAALDNHRRWRALIVLCLGVLMIVIDATVVNVALPSIREDLKFTANSLVWVVNVYMLAFGGSLLLGGRLGDLYGHRRLFLIGITVFTTASLACGLANTQGLLIVARALQGLGGSVVLAVALALIMNLFTDDAERAKAMGVYSFVCASGGSIGVLLGGTLTSVLNWHWIFLINVPIGMAVYALCLSLLPNIRAKVTEGWLDVWGAVTMMMSFTLTIYAVVDGNQAGWASAQTLSLLAFAATLFALFLMIEARAPTPLLPLGIFKLRNLRISNAVGALWGAVGSTWLFISALYMQLVLGYGPMQVGLAFLPSNVIAAGFALGLSAKCVRHFGIKKPLALGLLLIAIGIALFARAPVDGGFMTDVLPSMVFLGLGAGVAYNPLLLAGMSDVAPSESGLASGMINTSFMMGGALGLSILASISFVRTNDMLASGATAPVALIGGYHVALMLGAVGISTAALLGTAFLQTRMQVPAPEHGNIGAPAPASTDD